MNREGTEASPSESGPAWGSGSAVPIWSIDRWQRHDDRAFLRRKRRPQYPSTDQRAVAIVDLFSGCGGMTLGLAHAAFLMRLGLDVRLALDSDPDAVSVYRANFGDGNVECGLVEDFFDGDPGARPTATERETSKFVSRVDVLVGGPPCQGNSDLNNHTRRRDPRNLLYVRMARAAEILQPELVVIENVPTVVHDRGSVVDETLRVLQRRRYSVAHDVIRLERVGVPQARRRHLLIAHREPGVAAEILATIRDGELVEKDGLPRTVRWAIEDLLDEGDDSGEGFDASSRPTPANRQRIRWLFQNRAHVLDDSQRPSCHRDKPHTYKSIYGRMRWGEPAQTITTGFGSMGQGCYVHPMRRRTITPHEAARLQTFPDFFRFDAVKKRSAWARLIGNAVPPLLMLHVGRLWLAYRDALRVNLAIRDARESADEESADDHNE